MMFDRHKKRISARRLSMQQLSACVGGLLVILILMVTAIMKLFLGSSVHSTVPSEPDEKDSFVDVVDEKDQIIGHATFARVHLQGKSLTHRGSHIILLDRQGRVLLNRRTDDAYNWPSRWGFQGEHSHAGETYEACAHRMLVEEFNMSWAQARQTQLVTLRNATRFISKRSDYPDDVFCRQFVLAVDEDFHDSSVESSGKRWVTLEELYRWMAVAPQDFLHYDPPLFPSRYLLEEACRKALRNLENAAAKRINDYTEEPLVLVGPSGVGKGTLIKLIMQEYPDQFAFCVSTTTRKQRPGEVNGKDYHFVEAQYMQTEIEKGGFIEYAQVHTNMYGTSLAALDDVHRQRKIAILDIDIQGAQLVKPRIPRARFLFLAPPSMEVLEKRLRGRHTETERSLRVRLRNAEGEVEFSKTPGFFDSVLVVDDGFVEALPALGRLLKAWYPQLQGV